MEVVEIVAIEVGTIVYWDANMLVSMGSCVQMMVNWCESTRTSMCWGAHMPVNVGVRECMWLNVCESTCESWSFWAHICL